MACPRQLAPIIPVLVVPLITGCIGFGIGKAGADLELDTPQLSAVLSLDSDTYGLGAPIIAELALVNDGKLPVTGARPAHFTVEFYLRPHTSPEPIHTQMVSWPLETASYVPLEPGARHQRSHVLSRATLNPGDYDVFAVYRSEPEEGIELAATVGSNPVSIRITEDVAMERDSLGLIMEAEAARIASRHFQQPESRVDARMVMDRNVRMHQWWVTVYFATPTASGETYGSCFIDPYLGRVRSVTKERVQLDSTPRAVIQTTDSGKSGP